MSINERREDVRYLFDTHAHLTDPRFDEDRAQVIERATQEGVAGIICVCSDFKELDVFYRLLDGHDFIYGAAGIHPHNASTYEMAQPKLAQALTHNKIVALGEMGLDYYYDNSPREVQKEVFKLQLALAKKKNLPVIIHSRNAMQDTLEILDDAEISRGVMHCFSGEEEAMWTLLDMGLCISLAGVVTFPKASKVHNVAARVPLERLIVETDSPYLAPQPVRGKRNEPSFVKHIVEEIASLKKISVQELAMITFKNVLQLFKLDVGM